MKPLFDGHHRIGDGSGVSDSITDTGEVVYVTEKQNREPFNTDMYTIPSFNNGESFVDRYRRLDEDRKQGWSEIKRATLTSASGIFVLSFLSLQIEGIRHPELLVSAWVVLAIAITVLIVAHWMDHFISQSAERSHLDLGILLTDLLTRRYHGEIIDDQAIQEEWQKVVDDDQPKQNRRDQMRTFMDWVYGIANLCLVAGVVLLVVFGAENLF